MPLYKVTHPVLTMVDVYVDADTATEATEAARRPAEQVARNLAGPLGVVEGGDVVEATVSVDLAFIASEATQVPGRPLARRGGVEPAWVGPWQEADRA